MEIEKKLKITREAKGLTQEQVAMEVMVSRQTISNWENGRSLPDIISIIKLSELYNISVDELLKGDRKMQEKVEKDANIAKTNKTVIFITGAITLAALVIYVVSIFVGGNFNDFCEHAIRWLLAGIGIALAVTLLVNRNNHRKNKSLKGELIMKKLQIMAILLLLLGIWFCYVEIGGGSKIPDLASLISVVSGMICGIISLFVKEK